MRDKDVKRRAAAAVLGALLLIGAIAWAVRETNLLQQIGGDQRWVAMDSRGLHVDPATLQAMQVQLAGAAAAAPAWALLSPPQAPRPEVVQVRVQPWGNREVFAIVLGHCEASVGPRDDLHMRLLPVQGGGPCSFSAEYDVTAGRYRWFRFNDIELREPSGDPLWYQVRGGDWWADPATVATMRSQVLAQTAGHPRPHPGYIGPEREAGRPYVVQFQGRVLDGRRVVTLTGTCGATIGWPLLEWRMYEVYDGGDCVFDAVFDPTRGALEHFDFQGSA